MKHKTTTYLKSIYIILAITFVFIYDVFAQNPLGVYIDIDGKVKFWAFEANRNGNIDDTVYVSYNGERQMIDLRNLKYDNLTLLEAPREITTSSCNLDPSIHYDTTEISESERQLNTINFSFDYNQLKHFNTQTIQHVTTVKSQEPKEYMDDIRGAGLNDTTIQEVKSTLNNYIKRLTGKWESDEEREALFSKLSLPDTIIEKKAVYDYLVDLFVVYNYDCNNRLTKVIGYHWNLGVEVDNIRYDDIGNLVYFSRDKIGSIRHEYIFKYNNHAQVEYVNYIYSTVGANKDDAQYAYPEIQKMKFSYNSAGILNAQSQLQNDGSWLTTYYEIKF